MPKIIDLLYAEVNQMTDDSLFDLTGNDQVNSNDVDELVQNILNTNYGDIDLDGDVDFTDFITLANMFGNPASSWSQADVDGDGMIGFGDFNVLATNFGVGADVQDGSSLTDGSRKGATKIRLVSSFAP